MSGTPSFQRPALRTAAAHQRRVQPLTTIAHELAVQRPLVKGALGKPPLELARDAAALHCG